MGIATVVCSKCQNTIEITDLLNADLRLLCDKLVADVSGLEKQVERLRSWRSMENAPRDGTEVLLCVKSRAGIPGKCLVGHWMPGGHCIGDHPPIDAGWYFWTGLMFDLASKPMAWMPIPECETAATAKEE